MIDVTSRAIPKVRVATMALLTALSTLGLATTAPVSLAVPNASATVIDDFEDGDSSDWGFFGGNAAGGGGGVLSDRPYDGAFYLSTGWGGEGTASGFYGGAFRNLDDAAQVVHRPTRGSTFGFSIRATPLLIATPWRSPFEKTSTATAGPMAPKTHSGSIRHSPPPPSTTSGRWSVLPSAHSPMCSPAATGPSMATWTRW